MMMGGGPTRSAVVVSDGFGISSRVLLSRNALLFFVIIRKLGPYSDRYLSSTFTESTNLLQTIPLITKYNQQDATLYNLFISTQCSTCCRRFLCHSSGAHNSTYSTGYLSNIYCSLPLSWMRWNPSTIAAGSSKVLTSTRCCMYSCEFLVMGGGTA